LCANFASIKENQIPNGMKKEDKDGVGPRKEKTQDNSGPNLRQDAGAEGTLDGGQKVRFSDKLSRGLRESSNETDKTSKGGNQVSGERKNSET